MTGAETWTIDWKVAFFFKPPSGSLFRGTSELKDEKKSKSGSDSTAAAVLLAFVLFYEFFVSFGAYV